MQDPLGVTKAPRIPADLSGLSVGRFAIGCRLGSGGMGQVYRAQDTTLKRTVAIKRMASHLSLREEDQQRFLKEAQRASALNHPNVAAIYDVFEYEGELLLVMEYVDGTTLRQRLAGRPLELTEFFDLALQCAEGLAAAHSRGILHGDIKPENIMITPTGRVKILDFGVARHFAADSIDATQTFLTTNLGVSGTPAYMAPEVLQNLPHDGRADLFSLGLVFYEMLGGRQPFVADTLASTVGRVLRFEPLPVSDFNPAAGEQLAQLVSCMLQKEQDLRPKSTAELVTDLRTIAAGGVFSPQRPSSALGSSSNFLRKNWRYAFIGLVILLAALGFITWRRQVHSPAGTQAAAVLPETRILAILPVSAADNDPQVTALARGLVQSVAAKLGRISGERDLEVIPASNIQDKGITTLVDARKQFGATLGLTVDLRESSGMVRVAYSLLDAVSGRILNSDSITVPANDIFALEDSVAQGTITALKLDLSPDERTSLKVRGTTVPAAYNHYLQSRGYLVNWTVPENVDNAILLLKQAIKLDPNFGSAKAALGEAYWRKYWHTKLPAWTKLARAQCDQAISLGNAGIAGHACLGLMSDGTGDYEKAATEYRRATELDPRDESASIGLALALEHQGKVAQAEKIYQSTTAAHPQSWTAINMLGTFYFRQKNLPKAAEAFQKVTSLAPEGYAGFVNLGAVYNTGGHYPEAIEALKRSIILHPSYAAHVNLGNAYFYLHDFAAAAKAYEEAAKLNPKQYVTWGNLGEAYYYSGQKEKASSAYRKAVELALQELKVNPRDADILGDLAGYHSMLGHRDEALSLLEEALQYKPMDKQVYLVAASVHNQLGETGVALEWLTKSVQSGYPKEKLINSPVFENLKANPQYQQLMRSEKH